MREGPPTLRIREWSAHDPSSSDTGNMLRGLTLSDADRGLLSELQNQSLIRYMELKNGLAISVGPHIGTITLSELRVVVMPKIRIKNLMRMVAFAFDLSDLVVSESKSEFAPADHGLIDLLGLSLLHSVGKLVRGGLLPAYCMQSEDLTTLRGRLDMGHIATHPRTSTIRCTYDEFLVDHDINRILAAGVRLAAKVMDSSDLRLDLARTADRFFRDISTIQLNFDVIHSHLENLDRRSSHYRTALTLIALIHQGTKLGEHTEYGEMPLSSFLLNMNMVFERFIERYLKLHAPEDVVIKGQDVRSEMFSYLENPSRWKHPTIRPDFVLKRRGKIVAIADAKYKNRIENPPSSAEIYQLTTYGLSYPFEKPRQVLLLHPLSTNQADQKCILQFTPSLTNDHVQIHLIGVPIDSLLEEKNRDWFPFKALSNF